MFKRISIISLLIYLILIPTSLLLPQKPSLKHLSFTSHGTWQEIEGEVIYKRGGIVSVLGYSEALVTGKAVFNTTTGKTASSEKILEGVVSGTIPHGTIRWHPNWIAIVIGYWIIWLAVAFVFWLRKDEPQSSTTSATTASSS